MHVKSHGLESLAHLCGCWELFDELRFDGLELLLLRALAPTDVGELRSGELAAGELMVGEVMVRELSVVELRSGWGGERGRTLALSQLSSLLLQAAREAFRWFHPAAQCLLPSLDRCP